MAGVTKETRDGLIMIANVINLIKDFIINIFTFILSLFFVVLSLLKNILIIIYHYLLLFIIIQAYYIKYAININVYIINAFSFAKITII